MELVLPEVRLEEFAQVQGGVRLPCLEARVNLLAAIAAAVRALVEPVRIEAAVFDQHGQDALLVLSRQLAVQGAGVHRLGEQFGDVAAGVGHDPAGRHGLAVEALPVVEEGRAVVVGEDLQLDAELLAVAEERTMVVGDARRAEVRVQVVALVEVHPLPAAGLLDHVAAAHREVAPASAPGGFQDRAAVAGLRQFVGGGHAGDAGPENDHALPPARVRRQIERGRVGFAGPGQTQGLHGPVDRLDPGHGAEGLDEIASGHAHVRGTLLSEFGCPTRVYPPIPGAQIPPLPHGTIVLDI